MKNCQGVEERKAEKGPSALHRCHGVNTWGLTMCSTLGNSNVETTPLPSGFSTSASVETQTHKTQRGRDSRGHETHILIP